MLAAPRSTGMSAPLLDKPQNAAAFLADWTPARLLSAWIEEVSALGVTPASLVQTLQAEEPRFEWWPRTNLEQHRRSPSLQMQASSAHPTCSGRRQTIAYLLQAAGDSEATAAVLLSASLFMRVERNRTRYPREAWPPFAVAQTLLAWTRMHFVYRWEAECESTLPEHAAEAGLVITSAQQLVRFLALEHARVLHRFAPVYLSQATAQLNLASVSVRQDTAAAEPDELNLSVPAPAHSLRVPRDPARRRDPRWADLTRAELETLIWQKPQRELAREFRVSEATVAKRCKLLEIAKPERGFWRKGRAAASG
jgi:hypothetical protein